MIRRTYIARVNTYDEVRGAVLDALNIAEDEQIPAKYKLKAFELSVNRLLEGTAGFDQLAANSLGMVVPRQG